MYTSIKTCQDFNLPIECIALICDKKNLEKLANKIQRKKFIKLPILIQIHF